MTKDEITQVVIQALPYSSQIKKLDTQSEPSAIRFQWRSQSFRVTDNLSVETAGNGVLIGDDASILLEALLKRQAVDEWVKDAQCQSN